MPKERTEQGRKQLQKKGSAPSANRQAASPDQQITRADTTAAAPRSHLNPNTNLSEISSPLSPGYPTPLVPLPPALNLFLPTGLACPFVPLQGPVLAYLSPTFGRPLEADLAKDAAVRKFLSSICLYFISIPVSPVVSFYVHVE